jgi:hypothetical protein
LENAGISAFRALSIAEFMADTQERNDIVD